MGMKNKKGAPHKDRLRQLKRIEGQVRGVSNMIEEERYCMDILYQIKAIKSSLKTIENKILKDHLDHCVYEAIHSKKTSDRNTVLAEITDLLKLTS